MHSLIIKILRFIKLHIQSPTKSFSLIFDFSLGGIRNGGGGGGGGDGGGKVGLKKKCQNNEIWDHLHNQCHAVVCGALYTNVAGTCHQMSNWSSWVNTSTWMNSSCQRLALVDDDFHWLANGSVVVNKTGHVYDQGHFEVEKSGRIQICADMSSQHYFDYSAAQNYLSDVCLTVSVLCLAMHIAIHSGLPKLRNLPSKNLLSLSCALFLAQVNGFSNSFLNTYGINSKYVSNVWAAKLI